MARQWHVLELRHLIPDDWPTWRAVRLEALREAPQAFSSTLEAWQGPGDTEERWRQRLEAVALNVVAEVDGTAAGQVSGTAPDHGGTVELISMWVDPSVRRRGVGAALVGEVVAWSAQQAGTAVRLAVREANAPAIALYERCGFALTDVPADGGERIMTRPL